MVTEADVQDVARACRKLEKQLAQVSKLEQQLAQGKTLEANQLAKLQRKVRLLFIVPLARSSTVTDASTARGWTAATAGRHVARVR